MTLNDFLFALFVPISLVVAAIQLPKDFKEMRAHSAALRRAEEGEAPEEKEAPRKGGNAQAGRRWSILISVRAHRTPMPRPLRRSLLLAVPLPARLCSLAGDGAALLRRNLFLARLRALLSTLRHHISRGL